LIEAAQLADDAGHGRTDDRLVERPQEHRQHNAGKGNDNLFPG
jgi:hypothetical protein